MIQFRRIALLAIVAASTAAACARPTPEQQIVNDAAAALGGRDRILAVGSLVLRGEGTQYNLGQDTVPGARTQTFTVNQYTRTIDVGGGRSRTQQTRTPNFAYFQGPAPLTEIDGVAGDVAYNVAPDGTATRGGDDVIPLADLRYEILHHPVTAVRAALTEGTALANARTEGGLSLVDVNLAGQAFTLAIDATTKLPVSVTHKAAHINLGDVVISTTFAGYQAVGDLQLPARLTVKTDDFITGEYRISSQNVDGAGAGDLEAPPAAASAPAEDGPPMVTVEPIAAGIWRMAGGSHHSVLVEFADHLMLIEAPLSEARALAIIAKARETVPGKPLTQLVNTHHHFDHSAGVRAAVAEGLTVITHEGNRAFLEEITSRPHTLMPDALQRNPRPLMLETVSGERAFTDGRRTVTLYAVTGAHSETMLMAYFPRERILVEVDLYTPGRAAQSFSGKLLEDVQALKLRVDQLVALHGRPAPFAQLAKEVAAAAAATN